MHGIPVWDQMDVGICFSVVAADIADALRICKSPGRTPLAPKDLLSPLNLAIMACKGTNCPKGLRTQSDGTKALPFEGGYACNSLNYLRQNPGCSRGNFDKAFGEGTNASLLELERHYEAYQDLSKDPNISRDPRISATTFFAKDTACQLNQQGFQLPIDSNMGVLKKVLGGTMLDYFQYLAQEACPPQSAIRIKVPACQENSTSDRQTFLNALHQHFDQALDQAIPIEVAYCSDLYEKGTGYSGIIPNQGKKPLVKTNLCQGHDPNDPEDDGGHSSVLMGRRFNARTHKCQLLIKNSWGRDIEDLSRDWENESGKIWVDEDTLTRNLQGFSILGDQ